MCMGVLTCLCRTHSHVSRIPTSRFLSPSFLTLLQSVTISSTLFSLLPLYPLFALVLSPFSRSSHRCHFSYSFLVIVLVLLVSIVLFSSLSFPSLFIITALVLSTLVIFFSSLSSSPSLFLFFFIIPHHQHFLFLILFCHLVFLCSFVFFHIILLFPFVFSFTFPIVVLSSVPLHSSFRLHLLPFSVPSWRTLEAGHCMHLSIAPRLFFPQRP